VVLVRRREGQSQGHRSPAHREGSRGVEDAVQDQPPLVPEPWHLGHEPEPWQYGQSLPGKNTFGMM